MLYLRILGRIALAYGIIFGVYVAMTPGQQMWESFVMGALIGVGSALGVE